MRDKYLAKLLELIAEMQFDMRAGKTDTMDRCVMQALEILLSFYWFYQADDFYGYIATIPLQLNNPALNDTKQLVKNYLEAQAGVHIQVNEALKNRQRPTPEEVAEWNLLREEGKEQY